MFAWGLMALSAALVSAKSARDYCEEGGIANQNGEYDKALVAFNKAIRLDPSGSCGRKTNEITHGAYILRGLVYFNKGDYDRTLADYKWFTPTTYMDVDSWPHTLAEVYSKRGIKHYLNGEYEKAITDYDTALKLDRNMNYVRNDRIPHARLLAYRARQVPLKETASQLGCGSFEDCVRKGDKAADSREKIPYYSAALDQWYLGAPDADRLEVYKKRAIVYNSVRQYNRAVADLEMAEALTTRYSCMGGLNPDDPKNSPIYYNYAVAYRGLWKFGKAIHNYEAAVYPKLSEHIRLNMPGFHHLFMGATGKAIASFIHTFEYNQRVEEVRKACAHARYFLFLIPVPVLLFMALLPWRRRPLAALIWAAVFLAIYLLCFYLLIPIAAGYAVWRGKKGSIGK